MLAPHEFDAGGPVVRDGLEDEPRVERDDAPPREGSVERQNLDHVAPPERAVRPRHVGGPQRRAASQAFGGALLQNKRPARV